LIAFFAFAPNSEAIHSRANSIIAPSPFDDSSRPKSPATSTICRLVPETLASKAAVRLPGDFSNTRSSRCRFIGLRGMSNAM
jgi:hypothetical protein